ncbi:MAG: spermidine synthase [Kiritimatiellia bacterium]|jgi:spermidine synthase
MNDKAPNNQSFGLLRLSSLVFFLSGCSALIFETVWFRIASTVLGTTVWSAAVVLMAFMTGLGIGNGIVAYRGNSISNPIRFYVAIEIVIGLSGLGVIYLLPFLSDMVAMLAADSTTSIAWLNAIRFSISFIVLLVPAIAMGSTLPILQKALHAVDGSFTTSIARLYGWNTFGAVVGTLAAEFFLIYWLGLKGVGLVACSLNFVAALLLYNFAKTEGVQQIEETINSEYGRAKMILFAPAATGMLLLALEIIWFRYLLLAQNESSTLFATMLAVVLVGIAVGGLLVSRFSVFEKNLPNCLVYLPLVAAFSTVLGMLLFQAIFSNYLPLIRDSRLLFSMAAASLMLPTCIVSGMLFPLYGERLFRELRVNTQASGILTIANTFGAALGSSLATFVLLPLLGIEISLLVVVAVYLLVAILSLFPVINLATPKFAIPVTFALSGLVLLAFPYGSLDRSYRQFSTYLPGEELVSVNESIYATLQYYRVDRLGEPHSFRLVTNGYSMSGTEFGGERYMKLFAYLPAILHGDVKDVLLISYGVGNTAEAVTNLPTLERLDIVDVSRDIVEMSRPFHAQIGYGPLDDSRTHVNIEDGRFFLKTTDKKYDLITGEPPPPKTPTIVNLYSREFFELSYEHLNPGGLISYWLPIHDLHDMDSAAIIRAFCDVYEDCSLWNGHSMDWILIGSRDGLGSLSSEQLRDNWNLYANEELRDIGIETPGMLGATFMADNEELNFLTADVSPVTDNFPQRISSSTTGMLESSSLYGYMLNIENRKSLFENSSYIADRFPQGFREDTLASFNLEKIFTLIALNPHINDQLPYYWEALTQAMESRDLAVLPLLLLGSNPREQRSLARSPENEALDSQSAMIKRLFVDREYMAVVDRVNVYQQIASDPNSKLFHEQIKLLALALQGGLTTAILDGSTFLKDDVYRLWITDRYL